MIASKLRQTGSGNENIGVCKCSDELCHVLREEMVEQDMEAGEDEGVFSGDGGMASGCSTWIRLSESYSLSVGTLKLWWTMTSEGTWNIVAERRPATETVLNGGDKDYTYVDIRKLTARRALERRPVKSTGWKESS